MVVFQDMHEEWGYDMTLFIADFGGSLGFLLGVSILSVLEIIEGIILSICRIVRDKKRQKEKAEQDEQLREFEIEGCNNYQNINMGFNTKSELHKERPEDSAGQTNYPAQIHSVPL